MEILKRVLQTAVSTFWRSWALARGTSLAGQRETSWVGEEEEAKEEKGEEEEEEEEEEKEEGEEEEELHWEGAASVCQQTLVTPATLNKPDCFCFKKVK